MKKISLNVEALEVTSFTTDETHGVEGTVEGMQIATRACPSALYATSPCNTCYQGSCADSCGIPKTGQACYPC